MNTAPTLHIPPAESPILPTPDFRPDPITILRRYAEGFFPCFLRDGARGGPVGWRKYSHRGVQFLDGRIRIAPKQKRYVFAPRFQIRFNTAFADVVAACADLDRDGFTWITPGLVDGFVKLHEMGYAHSFECWQDARLVGGAFGLQLGSIVTIESMFHTADHASKAAYGQTLLRLRQRGFTLVDVNDATDHFARFGAETIRQWRYEQLLRTALGDRPCLDDSFPARPLPLRLQIELPVARVYNGLKRRVRRIVRLPEAA
jgi:leucyl/phenylalanyl-tRNA--protein transferase